MQEHCNPTTIAEAHFLAWQLEAIAHTCQNIYAAQISDRGRNVVSDGDQERLLALLTLNLELQTQLRRGLGRLNSRRDPTDTDEAETIPGNQATERQAA